MLEYDPGLSGLQSYAAPKASAPEPSPVTSMESTSCNLDSIQPSLELQTHGLDGDIDTASTGSQKGIHQDKPLIPPGVTCFNLKSERFVPRGSLCGRKRSRVHASGRKPRQAQQPKTHHSTWHAACAFDLAACCAQLKPTAMPHAWLQAFQKQATYSNPMKETRAKGDSNIDLCLFDCTRSQLVKCYDSVLSRVHVVTTHTTAERAASPGRRRIFYASCEEAVLPGSTSCLYSTSVGTVRART